MNILFMLPARSGSKGVKDKNIKLLDGKPLMYYAINAIMSSNTYKKHNCYLFVNTDSEKYAEVAKECGAKVPFLRKKELAGDESPVTETIKDTYSYFEDEERKVFDIFSMIQVTSPLIDSEDIDRAIQFFEEDYNLESISSVTESEVMPLWCNTLSDDFSLKNFISAELRKKNRQDLPKYYRLTGAIRAARWDAFKKNQFDWFSGKCKACEMSNYHSVDIDTELDFDYAEFLIKRR